MEWYQQGDVMMKPVKQMPETVKKVQNNVLARGEATGHCHEAFGQDVALYMDVELYKADANLYLVAPEGAEVRHQEHDPVKVPPGVYVIQIVREYDHFAEESRRVYD